MNESTLINIMMTKDMSLLTGFFDRTNKFTQKLVVYFKNDSEYQQKIFLSILNIGSEPMIFKLFKYMNFDDVDSDFIHAMLCELIPDDKRSLFNKISIILTAKNHADNDKLELINRFSYDYKSIKFLTVNYKLLCHEYEHIYDELLTIANLSANDELLKYFISKEYTDEYRIRNNSNKYKYKLIDKFRDDIKIARFLINNRHCSNGHHKNMFRFTYKAILNQHYDVVRYLFEITLKQLDYTTKYRYKRNILDVLTQCLEVNDNIILDALNFDGQVDTQQADDLIVYNKLVDVLVKADELDLIRMLISDKYDNLGFVSINKIKLILILLKKYSDDNEMLNKLMNQITSTNMKLFFAPLIQTIKTNKPTAPVFKIIDTIIGPKINSSNIYTPIINYIKTTTFELDFFINFMNKTDPNHSNYLGCLAIHAIRNDESDFALEILSKLFPIRENHNFEQVLLLVCIRTGSMNVLNLLIKNKYCVSIVENIVLEYAVEMGNVEVVKLLLDTFNFNILMDGQMPLRMSLENRDQEMTRLILDRYKYNLREFKWEAKTINKMARKLHDIHKNNPNDDIAALLSYYYEL